jgi:hypothetical protein
MPRFCTMRPTSSFLCVTIGCLSVVLVSHLKNALPAAQESSTSLRAVSNSQSAGGLACDITASYVWSDRAALHLTVALTNTTYKAVSVRDMVLGYNLSVFVCKAGETEFVLLHPPGSYLSPGLKIIEPGGTLMHPIKWPFGISEYTVYCEYSSVERDTNVTWYGRASSPIKRLQLGMLKKRDSPKGR